MNPSTEPFRRAQQCARFFRSCGWNALPSRMNVKGPMLPAYADYWAAPLPDAVYDDWRTTNIQVMTGAHWRLCVVDCDGDEAHHVFRAAKNRHGFEGNLPTWTCRTGGGGWHYWFTLPAWLDECPSRRVWGLWDAWGGPKHAGDWVGHKEIRLLGDNALAIAPPSVHVKTGREYEWMPGHGPDAIDRPMPVPGWVLDLPAVAAPPAPEPLPSFTPVRPPVVKTSTSPRGAFYERDEVLSAVPDKIALARSWGLRIASQRPNPKGWVSCHAVDRADDSPSASFSPDSGVYAEMRDGVRLSLFDLAVALGAYPDWQTCKADLAARFVGVPGRPRN